MQPFSCPKLIRRLGGKLSVFLYFFYFYFQSKYIYTRSCWSIQRAQNKFTKDFPLQVSQ